jgi:hypothetical protein
VLQWAVDTVAAAWKACTKKLSAISRQLSARSLQAAGSDHVGADTLVRPGPARKSGAFCFGLCVLNCVAREPSPAKVLTWGWRIAHSTTLVQQRITLALMNTGNTRPFAHDRSLSTFSRMADYPFDERVRRGPYYRAVELAVEVGVPNVMDYVLEAAEMKCSTCDKEKDQSIQTLRKLYP